jgi:hypothetical protein
MATKKVKLKYNGWELDSQEELYFCWWLEELLNDKYIKSFNRADSIPIYDPKKLCFGHHCRAIIRELNYEPDFIIEWYSKANGIFYITEGKEYSLFQVKNTPFISLDGKTSLVDVKGLFQGPRLSTSITFPFVQKLLFHEKNIFINKIIPLGDKGLFANTFTPTSYLTTPTGKERKLKWEPRSLEEYLKSK